MEAFHLTDENEPRYKIQNFTFKTAVTDERGKENNRGKRG
jgi:hypothetical protein